MRVAAIIFLGIVIGLFEACGQPPSQNLVATPGGSVCTATSNFVLGHLDFISSKVNDGNSAPSAQVLQAPTSVTCVANRIFVADSGNNRVLIWNSMPTLNKQAADLVLGQISFTLGAANQGASIASAATMSNPQTVFSDGTRLFVADTGNNRILIWNTLPLKQDQSADAVLGQPSLTSNTAATSSTGLSSPQDIFFGAGHIFVADTGNNRVLFWNSSLPSQTGPANIVLGQSDFISSNPNSSSASVGMNGPNHVYFKNNVLYVTDSENNRVLVWNTLPTTNGQTANFAIGQSDLVSTGFNSTSIMSLQFPGQVSNDGIHFYIADFASNRVLGWPVVPSSFGQTPSIIFGQSGFSNETAGTSATQINGPTGLYSSPTGGFFLADKNNNRILLMRSP